MPSTYAHYKFGCSVLNKLTGNRKRAINKYRSLYSLGLHGPDLFFYYRPFVANHVSKTGFGMHERPGIEFFEQAGNLLKKKNYSPAYAAYIYGFICHFALDRECHGYIDQKIASSKVPHVEIEAEFDRSLLLHDGFNPVKKCLTEHIHPSKEAANVIKDFFPDITEREVFHSMHSLIFYNDLLRAPSKIKRQLIYTTLHLTGHEDIRGMVINRHSNPLCRDSTKKLYSLYDQAIDKAVRLINEFTESASKQKPYDPLFKYTFSSRLIENN